MTTEKTVVAI